MGSSLTMPTRIRDRKWAEAYPKKAAQRPQGDDLPKRRLCVECKREKLLKLFSKRWAICRACVQVEYEIWRTALLASHQSKPKRK